MGDLENAFAGRRSCLTPLRRSLRCALSSVRGSAQRTRHQSASIQPRVPPFRATALQTDRSGKRPKQNRLRAHSLTIKQPHECTRARARVCTSTRWDGHPLQKRTRQGVEMCPTSRRKSASFIALGTGATHDRRLRRNGASGHSVAVNSRRHLPTSFEINRILWSRTTTQRGRTAAAVCVFQLVWRVPLSDYVTWRLSCSGEAKVARRKARLVAAWVLVRAREPAKWPTASSTRGISSRPKRSASRADMAPCMRQTARTR